MKRAVLVGLLLSGCASGIRNPQVYQSGGRFGSGWQLHCKDSIVDSSRQCMVSKAAVVVVFMRQKNGDYAEALGAAGGGSTFPGSELAVKVDGNPGIGWNDGETPLAQWSDAITQMTKGKEVLIRFAVWPSRAERQVLVTLDGFPEAATQARKNMNAPAEGA